MPVLQLCCDTGGVLWPSPELQLGSVCFISGPARPSPHSTRTRSPPPRPSRERHQHRPDGTTDCSCHHTGPSPPGYREQGDGVFRGRTGPTDTGQATAPALGPRAQQPKRPSQSQSSSGDCSGAKTAPPCDKEAKGVAAASLPPS